MEGIVLDRESVVLTSSSLPLLILADLLGVVLGDSSLLMGPLPLHVLPLKLIPFSLVTCHRFGL